MPTGWEVVGSESVPVEGGWDIKGSDVIDPNKLSAGDLAKAAGNYVAGGIAHGAGTLADVVTGTSPGPGSHAERWASHFPVAGPLGETPQAGQDLASGISKAYDTVAGTGPLAQTLKERIPQAAEAIGTVVPPLRGAGAAIDTARAAATTVPTAIEQAGFRTAQGHPIANVLAGSTGKDALTIHNQQVGNAILGQEAGVAPGTPLNYDSLAAAREAPNSVYERAGQAIPAGPLSPGAQQSILAASQRAGRITQGSPDALNKIGALQQQLLAGPVTGEQVVNELRGLRQEGYANLGSDDVSNQELGHAQLAMSRGLEQHIADTLPAGAPVSLDQLQAARTALAKNHAVQGALRGNDVDLGAVARLQRADPDLLTGGLKVAADFANANPPVTGLASRIYEPPSYGQDLMGVPGTHRIENFLSPTFWSGVGGGTALARRVLTGNTDAAIARARGAFPGTLGEEFGPIEPGAMHPQPFPHDTGGLELAQGGPPAAAGGAQGGIPLADVLSHGVEQTAPAGLSLADELGVGGRPGQGIPFRPNLEHAAGGLELAPEPGAAPPGAPNGDHAAVASQGVPEGIVARSAPAFRPRKRDTRNLTPDLGTILGGGPRGE